MVSGWLLAENLLDLASLLAEDGGLHGIWELGNVVVRRAFDHPRVVTLAQVAADAFDGSVLPFLGELVLVVVANVGDLIPPADPSLGDDGWGFYV